MSFNYKKIGILMVPILSLSPLSSLGALELGMVKSVVSNVESMAGQASTPCVPSDPNFASCNSCAEKLKSVSSDLKQSVDAALKSYNAGTGAGAVGVAVAGMGPSDAQKNSVNTGKNTNEVGKGAQDARAASSAQAAKAFERCQQDAKSACPGGVPNKQVADEISNECKNGQTVAGEVAKEKAASSGSLSDMAGMLGQAAQALGPLMQAMQKPPGASESGVPKTPSNISKPTPVAGSKLSDGATRAAGGAIGFGGGTGTSMDGAGANAASGYASPYEARDFSADPNLAESLGGSDPGGKLGSAGSGGFSASGAGSSGGGGFGSKDSSGASTMGEKPNAILDPGAFEVGAGGGGSSGKPFLGLKSKSLDLADLAGDAGGSGVIGEGGFDEGGRDLASSDGNSDIHSEEGGTLFEAIRMKYSEIKKRGNI
jgi:hypothetical protein